LGEATGACWGDINWHTATWTIPRERQKSDHVHVVPLSRQALALLRERMPEGVAPGDLIFASDACSTLGNWDRAGKWFQERAGVADWTRHDLRRSAATAMGELGVDPHVIECCLGHAVIHSGLASVYNRSRYLAQTAVALQLLGDALDGIGRRRDHPTGCAQCRSRLDAPTVAGSLRSNVCHTAGEHQELSAPAAVRIALRILRKPAQRCRHTPNGQRRTCKAGYSAPAATGGVGFPGTQLIDAHRRRRTPAAWPRPAPCSSRHRPGRRGKLRRLPGGFV
jgi:hypothetical protein